MSHSIHEKIFFRTGFYCVAQAGLEPMVIVLQPPEC